MADATIKKMSPTDLTAREMNLVTIVLKYCVGGAEGLKVDMKALAEHGGFKTSNSASASWSVIRKKLFASVAEGCAHANGVCDAINGEADDGAPPTPVSAKKKGGRKLKAAVSDVENSEATPTKKRSGKSKEPNSPTPKRAKKEEAAIEDAEADGDGCDNDEPAIKAEDHRDGIYEARARNGAEMDEEGTALAV